MDCSKSSGKSGELLARRLAAAAKGYSRLEEQLRAQERELELIFREQELHVDLPSGLPDFTGSEHEVWCDGERVLKATLPGGYGRLWGERRFASPLEYVQRVQWVEKRFGLPWRIGGLSQEMGRIRIISTQPYLKGKAPSLKQIAHYMKSLGFVLRRSRYGEHWLHEADGVIAFDAEPGNFVETAFGLVPVDIILQKEAP